MQSALHPCEVAEMRQTTCRCSGKFRHGLERGITGVGRQARGKRACIILSAFRRLISPTKHCNGDRPPTLMHYNPGSRAENCRCHRTPSLTSCPVTSLHILSAQASRPANKAFPMRSLNPITCSWGLDTHGELERKVNVRFVPQTDVSSPGKPSSPV
jgi:hypothetical protein